MAIIESEGVQAIVLGLPLDMKGAETLTTRQTLNFRDSLARRTTLPIHLVNEALTSFDARSACARPECPSADTRRCSTRWLRSAFWKPI
jgi:RNase H-fold protein (predicted Holliday junction resolvase)